MLVQKYHSVHEISCFSQHAPFDDLVSQIPQVVKCHTFEDALKGVDVVITTTTANSPYIEPHHVPDDQLLVNLSLMDFAIPIFTGSDIIVDD